MKKISKKPSYTLLTNIAFIQRKGDNMRLNCHALLITEDDGFLLGPTYTIRGFGTEAAWDNFSIWLDKDAQLPFTLKTAEDRSSIILSHDGTENPLFSGNALILKDGTEFFLQADTSSRPIDVFKDNEIGRVWKVLYENTAEYWHAPYMPRLTYGPPSKLGSEKYA